VQYKPMAVDATLGLMSTFQGRTRTFWWSTLLLKLACVEEPRPLEECASTCFAAWQLKPATLFLACRQCPVYFSSFFFASNFLHGEGHLPILAVVHAAHTFGRVATPHQMNRNLFWVGVPLHAVAHALSGYIMSHWSALTFLASEPPL